MNYQSSLPKGFASYTFKKTFSLKEKRCEKAWQKLQKRETFTRGQIPPYKVEFHADSQKGNFKEGELNIHHGPFLSVHGAIGEISECYRDLQYFYGSYVLSFRLIRPTRLEFFKKDNIITVKIHYYLKPWIKPLWIAVNFLMWRSFGLTVLR